MVLGDPLPKQVLRKATLSVRIARSAVDAFPSTMGSVGVCHILVSQKVNLYNIFCIYVVLKWHPNTQL